MIEQLELGQEVKHLSDLILNYGEDQTPEPECRQKVKIWTDGGCWPNPGPGGWGAVVEKWGQFPETGERYELRGESDGTTTNNRMEITAAIEALRSLDQPSVVIVTTDSRYLQSGAMRCAFCISDRIRWRYGVPPEPWKLNQDLWYQLMDVMRGHKISWKWVRGHTGDKNNERADKLAQRSLPQA